MRKRILTFLICLTVFSAVASSAHAQTSLPTLPESDALLLANGRRLITEALPRVLPEQTAAEMRKVVEHIKLMTGIDLAATDMLVAALRFRNMSPTNSVPDFLLALRGTFKANPLLKTGEEKYGTKTITVLKLAESAGPNAKVPPFLTELSLITSDNGMLMVGSNQYVKAAIDAADGKARINPDLSALATRDSSAMLSAAALIPPGFIANFIPKEAQGNPDIMKMLNGINRVFLSVGMGASDFPLTLMVGTADADQARMLGGLAEMGASLGAGSVKEKPLQDLLRSVKVTVSGTEVQAQATAPIEVVAGLLNSLFKPKPAAATTDKK
jgi:hypothetical protein